MIRTGATEIVLFLLPFVLYAVFLLATRANVVASGFLAAASPCLAVAARRCCW